MISVFCHPLTWTSPSPLHATLLRMDYIHYTTTAHPATHQNPDITPDYLVSISPTCTIIPISHHHNCQPMTTTMTMTKAPLHPASRPKARRKQYASLGEKNPNQITKTRGEKKKKAIQDCLSDLRSQIAQLEDEVVGVRGGLQYVTSSSHYILPSNIRIPT